MNCAACGRQLEVIEITSLGEVVSRSISWCKNGCRFCLCGDVVFDHSEFLTGAPCLNCPCPGFMLDGSR